MERAVHHALAHANTQPTRWPADRPRIPAADQRTERATHPHPSRPNARSTTHLQAQKLIPAARQQTKSAPQPLDSRPAADQQQTKSAAQPGGGRRRTALRYRDDGGVAQLPVRDVKQADRAGWLPAAVGRRPRVEDPQPPSADSSSGMCECPNTTRAASGNLRRIRPSRRRWPAVVDHRHRQASDRDLGGRRRAPRGDVRAVVVPDDRRHGRVLRDLRQHQRRARVPGVHDEVRGAQVLRNPRRAGLPATRPVGVREDDNTHHSAELGHLAGAAVLVARDRRQHSGQRGADLLLLSSPKPILLRLARGGNQADGGCPPPAALAGPPSGHGPAGRSRAAIRAIATTEDHIHALSFRSVADRQLSLRGDAPRTPDVTRQQREAGIQG